MLETKDYAAKIMISVYEVYPHFETYTYNITNGDVITEDLLTYSKRVSDMKIMLTQKETDHILEHLKNGKPVGDLSGEKVGRLFYVTFLKYINKDGIISYNTTFENVREKITQLLIECS